MGPNFSTLEEILSSRTALMSGLSWNSLDEENDEAILGFN
jgi:hypothetical protein